MKISTPSASNLPLPEKLFEYLRIDDEENTLDNAEKDVIRFVKMSHHATIPTRATEKSAGLDLYACQNTTILPNNEAIMKTDLQVCMPPNTYGRIAPRSGLAMTNCIAILGGVIDADYTGNIAVILFNHGITPCIINKGDRIAQLICEKYISPRIIEDDHIEPTIRGASGFGSSGI